MIRVLFCPGDIGGCGYYRLLQVFSKCLLDLRSKIDPVFLGCMTLHNVDQQVTYLQRVCGVKGFDEIRKFKESSKSKIIIDYDDLLWDKDNRILHKYNMFLNRIDLKTAYKDIKENLADVADAVTVSNDALKDSLKEFYPEDRIFVLRNRLSMKEWSFDRTVMIPKDDSFFYSGSMSHYSNKDKFYGDFSIPLANFLKTQTTMFMGDEPPWFFEKCEMREDWADLSVYAQIYKQFTNYAKFTLAPLENNHFNKFKSDLKYLESCAVGRVCLVSDFDGSPYHLAHPLQKLPQNASINEIRDIVENCKSHYGEILNYQYDYLNLSWLDDHMNQYETLFSSVL